MLCNTLNTQSEHCDTVIGVYVLRCWALNADVSVRKTHPSTLLQSNKWIFNLYFLRCGPFTRTQVCTVFQIESESIFEYRFKLNCSYLL